MRPFLIEYLKCTKCNSEKNPKINCKNFKKIENKSYVKDFVVDEAKLMNYIDGFESIANEADVYEFLNDKKDDNPIMDLLFNIDIEEGSLCCVDCGKESEIKDGILIIE